MKKTRGVTLGLKVSLGVVSAGLLFASATATAATGDAIHAYYADEHNVSPNNPTGNRILEFDIDNMQLVNALDVPGLKGHHADNGFNSKIYGVPKASNFVNAIDLRKDQSGNTTMKLTKQIKLIHQPRSGDAYNQKYNIILMAAKNRPMGSFINVETDEVVGTIGENVDCKLTDGSRLLSHADANTPEGAMKYQCAHKDFGGNQISGHPYWLTTDYAAIVDRSNRQISVYKVWEQGGKIKSRLVNHLKTRTSIHQIIPRDRTQLPGSQQADFYAIEEGNQGSQNRYGVPHALLKLKLTTAGLKLVKRMNLARSRGLSRYYADYLKRGCRAIATDYSGASASRRYYAFKRLFNRIGMYSYADQDYRVDFPVECLSAKENGGHNADFTNSFAPDNNRLFVGTAGGYMHIIDVNSWKVINTVSTGGMEGVKSGSGHTCFAPQKGLAIVTNHQANYQTVINLATNRKIKDIYLPFEREGIFNATQSHTCYVDKANKYYYNAWTDGGVFYKIDLDSLSLVDSVYVGGIPIQGNYISLSNIKTTTPTVVFAVNNDTATSDGTAITIDVLANDTGENLMITAAGDQMHGTLEIVNGKLYYTPNQGFSGTDEIWYGVISGGDYSNEKWALVTVTVNSSTPPAVLKAKPDSANTTSGTPVTIDVLANDTGNGLTIGWVDDAYGGTVVKQNGKLVYTPKADFSGTDEFWYELKSSNGEFTAAKVTVTVTGSAPAISTQDDTATVVQGDSVTIDVLGNDTGADLRIFDTGDVWTGTFSVTDNKIVYNATGETGTAEIWYGVKDASGNESWSKVTITITASGSGGGSGSVALKANNDTATVAKGQSITIDVLANDSGNDIRIFNTSDVWTGSFIVEANKIVYQAGNQPTDSAEIWYGIKDAAGNESWALLTITVTE